jgi:diguanylate cyclase (GGDEF)-like protein
VENDSVGPGLWLEIVSPIMSGSAVVAALVAHRPLGQESFLIQAIMRDVMITAIVGISGLLLMFFVGFHLVFLRRLRRLGEASQLIAGGHYEAHVAISGRDELAVLGATFNQMARSIESAIEERKVAEQKLQQLAITDGLTGLMNYREFQRQLDTEIERSQRYNHPLALLMIDIDHFKRVNDAHGHPAGDAVLKALADAIRGSIRTIDMAARYGGEEFVVILPETPLDGARIVAERLRRRVAEHPLTGPAGQRLTCSVSVGVAILPEDAVRKEPLIDAADQALYGAKSAGRNTVKSYQDVCRITSAEPAGKTPIPSAE